MADDEQAAQPLDRNDDNDFALADCVNATAVSHDDDSNADLVRVEESKLADTNQVHPSANMSPVNVTPILVQPSIVLYNRTTPTIIVTPVSHTNLSSLHLNQSTTYEETSITELRVDNSDSFQNETNSNATARELFKLKLDATYPRCLVIKLSLVFLVINTIYSILESKYRFERSVYFVYASKIIFLTSISNIFYALLALITVKVRNYFLIQLTTFLHLIGFISSLLTMFITNIVLTLTQAILNYCTTSCLLIEFLKLNLSLASAFLAIIFFYKMQFSYIANLNKDSRSVRNSNYRFINIRSSSFM